MLYLAGAGLFLSANINIMANTVQDEGNACFDMASAMPGLKSVTGKHGKAINTQHSDEIGQFRLHQFIYLCIFDPQMLLYDDVD